jgi:hypothetical protein
MVWDSARKVAILFGGIGPDLDPFGTATLFNDVWEFDPKTSEWSKAQVVGPSPAPRMHPGMAYDADRKRVVLFGGQDTRDADSLGDFLDDTWEYDPAARTWAAMNVGNRPNFRSGTSLAYDPVRKKTVLFGGFERATYYDTTVGVERHVVDAGRPVHRPDGRAFHAMTWSAQLGKIVLYGGFVDDGGTFNTAFGDVWAWDGTDWVEIPQPSGSNACSGHAMAYDPTRAHLLSVGDCGSAVTRLLEYPYGGPWQTARDDGPPPRTLAALVISDDGIAILHGGRNFDVVRGDTWVLHGFTPELVPQPLSHGTPPCFRNELHVAARTDVNGVGPFTYRWRRYTANGGFGQLQDGFRFSGTTTDTLVIDPFRPEDAAASYSAVVSNECGTTESSRAFITLTDASWEQTGALPSPRSYIDMAYDTARQRMVSFGGRTIFTDFTILNFGDTIERVGTTWTEVAPSGPSPAPRSGYALAYDPVHAVTVLHGGVSLEGLPNFGSTLYGDTWAWNGTSWTLLATSGPSARDEHKMIWDAARQRIVLFGGRGDGSNDFLGDLWEWDGTTWTPRATAGDPTYGFPYGRYEHGLAYDADRSVIVMHGGVHLLSPPYSVGGDTWELAGSQWQRRAAAAPGGAVDNPLYHPTHRGMAYHASRGKTLLAGSPLGNTSEDPSLTITFWEWQPAGAWRQLPGFPPWRISPALGYDPRPQGDGAQRWRLRLPPWWVGRQLLAGRHLGMEVLRV